MLSVALGEGSIANFDGSAMQTAMHLQGRLSIVASVRKGRRGQLEAWWSDLRLAGRAPAYHRDVVPEHESETWTHELAAPTPASRPAVAMRPDRGLAEAILDAVGEAIIVLDPDSGHVV
jgi:hypothetical protein